MMPALTLLGLHGMLFFPWSAGKGLTLTCMHGSTCKAPLLPLCLLSCC